MRITPIRLPLRRKLETGSGSIESRESLLLRVKTDEGLVGAGEAVQVPGFPTESLAEARVALDGACRSLIGTELPEEDALEAESSWARPWREALSSIGAARPAARAALDGALLDVVARGLQFRLADLLALRTQVPVRERLAVNALVSGMRVPTALLEAATAVSAGHGTLKIKLPHRDIGGAIEVVRTVRAAVGDEIRIRADLNGSLDREQALALVRGLEPFDLEYLEQPVPAADLDGLIALRRAGHVAIAADESAATLGGARRVLEARAADVIIIKPSVLGGARAALAVAAQARKAGVPVVVTSAIESRIGLAASLHLAAALPPPHGASGLGTATWIERDVVSGGLEAVDGSVSLPEADGLGFTPDPEALAELRTGPDLVIS